MITLLCYFIFKDADEWNEEVSPDAKLDMVMRLGVTICVDLLIILNALT